MGNNNKMTQLTVEEAVSFCEILKKRIVLNGRIQVVVVMYVEYGANDNSFVAGE